MATGSQTLTTYYAKRIIGDAAAANASSALLQTGANIATDIWILNRTSRATNYGIKYAYDTTTTTIPAEQEGEEDTVVDNEHDKIQFVGDDTVTAWVQLDTGDAYFCGQVGIGASPNSNYQLYVYGTSYFNDTVSVPSTLYIRAQNTTTEGGQLQLAADPDHSSYAAILDVCNNYFRIISNSTVLTKMILSSGTITTLGNINIQNVAGSDIGFYAKATGYTDSKELTVSLLVGSGKKNHGIYSYGYSTDGTTFTADSKWMIYRNSAGTIIVNGDCTGNAATATALTGGLTTNDVTTHGNLKVTIAKGSYYGINFGGNASGMSIMSINASHQGLYNQTNGQWIIYYNAASDSKSIVLGNSTVNVTGGISLNLNTKVTGTLTITSATDMNNDLNLYTSSADSPDIVWWYANKGKEQARIWMGSGFSAKTAPNFREYKSDGTSLYSGCLVLGDGTGASGSWGISVTGSSASCTGNAATCSYPAGFSSRSTNATWGNTTGATITSWGEGDGGSIDFRKNNPSSGKLSVKVDGRFYGNEGANPAMLTNYTNNYWGMGDPDGASNVWIRTTSQGIIPYQSGNVGGGHCGLGTSSWFFSTAYIDTIHSHQLICEGTTSATMTSASTNPRITFQEGTGTQPVHLIYTDYDGYRSPAGLKVIGGASATPAWFEVEGDYYGRGINLFPKDLASYNEGLRIHCSNGSWATIMLCGTDNTGGTGTSTNSWGIFNNNGTLYINKATSSGAGAPRVYANANGWYFDKAYGAVWNDFAEYRQAEINEPGRVIIPSITGIAKISTERLQSGGRIISDTFGFSVGASDKAKTPVGISGRVLAYPYQNIENYKIGDCVCTAPNGTVDIMTREEIKEYPDRIIGIVNEIPNYEIWQESLDCPGGEPTTTQIKVKGRIWIDIK